MPRNYADNAQNRSLGRVGMAHGTAVHSASSNSSSTPSGSSGYSSSSSTRVASNTASSSSSRTYVDNSQNRTLGRVGMALGSQPHSSSSTAGASNATSSSSSRTYVDNSQNRTLGRVGMALGSQPHSSSSTTGASNATSSSLSRTYVDNSQNRTLGRVGMALGSQPHSSSSTAGASNATSSFSTKTYVDNSQNRRLGRVGKALCSQPQSSSSTADSSSVEVTKKRYVNNYFNRKCGRVGKLIGTHVVRREKIKEDVVRREKIDYDNMQSGIEDSGHQEFIKEEWEAGDMHDLYDIEESRLRQEDIEKKWKADKILPRTDHSQITGQIEIISQSDLGELDFIGEGGFGKVYAALWKNTPIAFKKLSNHQGIARKKRESFMKEITLFSKLDHTNIVKMFGYVMETDAIGIVMEYLPQTLFKAIFCVEEVVLTISDKKRIIGEVASALEYLHTHYPKIAHCDMKSQNILLDSKNVVKLCDFGLSVIKNTVQSSRKVADAPPGQGTPRYSAPEVLQGELLNIDQLMMSDMYSLSLVVYEVLVQEEPYDGFNIHQLEKNVGRGDVRPPLEDLDKPLVDEVKLLLTACWNKTPAGRPDVTTFLAKWTCMSQFFITQ